MCVLLQRLINDIFWPSNETFGVPTWSTTSECKDCVLTLGECAVSCGFLYSDSSPSVRPWAISYVDLKAYNAWHVSHLGKRMSSLLDLVVLLYLLVTGFGIVIYGEDTEFIRLMMIRKSSRSRKVWDLIVFCVFQTFYFLWLEMMMGDMLRYWVES